MSHSDVHVAEGIIQLFVWPLLFSYSYSYRDISFQMIQMVPYASINRIS